MGWELTAENDAGTHEYMDLSKRRPYICGICGRDILHPIHQPKLPGIRFAIPERKPKSQPGEPELAPEIESQFSLF